MTHVRHLLIAAVLLSATHTGWAAEPLEEGHRAAWRDSEPADPRVIQANWVGIEIGGAVPASHAVQRVGIGLGLSNDSLVNGFTSRDGVYHPSFGRIAERNTAYGLPSETLGLNDNDALSAFCCQRSLASPQQHASAGSTLPLSPTIYVFAVLRKKGWDIEFKDGWKLHAGGRSREYSQTFKTKVGFLSVERFWESFRASYSFQAERSKGQSLAPSQVLWFDYLYGPGESIGVSYADGSELADVGTLGILNTEMRGMGLRGQHRLNKNWAFTYQAGHSDRGSLPAYDAVRLGLQRSF